MGNIRIKFLILIILVFGCNEPNKKLKGKKAVLLNTDYEVTGQGKNATVFLPDTISIKDTLKGHLIYKSLHDSIKTDSTSLRIVDLLLAKTEQLSENLDGFKKKDFKTFIRLQDSIIPIYDITFKKKGLNFMEGYVIDELYLYENKDSYRKKRLTQHVFFGVYVE